MSHFSMLFLQDIHWQINCLFLTYKPAIITFLHHLYNVSFSELQLVWILWFVVVNSFISKIENKGENKINLLPHESTKAARFYLGWNNVE